MRRAAKIDDNQNEIVEQLRCIPGVSVKITSMLGDGFPDLVIGIRKKNFLIELKDGKKSESRKRLTDDEEQFFLTWNGQVNKAESFDEILKIIQP